MKHAMVALALGLAACGGMGVSEIAFTPAARPPAGMALVYVFHGDAEASLLTVPEVRIDGRPVATLRAPEYTAVHLRAGRHVASLAPGGEARSLEIDVAAGQIAALVLAYTPPTPDRQGYTFKTKQGEIAIPTKPGEAAEYPFAWRVVPNIEANALYPELRRRRLRASETAEIAPR